MPLAPLRDPWQQVPIIDNESDEHERSASSNDEGTADEGHFTSVSPLFS